MQGIGDQQEGHAAVEQGEVAHHVEDGLLLRALDMGRADELGATSILRARAGGDDLGHRFAPSDERTGIGLEVRAGLDGHGLAREHGVVDQDLSGEGANIGGHDGTERQLDHVPLDQFGRYQRLPCTVAKRRGRQGQASLQRVQGRLCTALLEEAQGRVENQQKCHRRGLDILPERQLQDDGRLQHPRDGRPELLQGPSDRTLDHLHDGIRPVGREAAPCLAARQAGGRIEGRTIHSPCPAPRAAPAGARESWEARS